jgi:hypothetical protein
MWVFDVVEFGIVEIMTEGGGAAAFNYFFTLVWVFGLVAFAIGLMMRVVSRS